MQFFGVRGSDASDAAGSEPLKFITRRHFLRAGPGFFFQTWRHYAKNATKATMKADALGRRVVTGGDT